MWLTSTPLSSFIHLVLLGFSVGNPNSNPYIPFRTSPFDQSHLHHILSWDNPVPGTNSITSYNADDDVNGNSNPNHQCPLQFTLGVSHRHHHVGNLAIVEAPIIYPALPQLGPGRQVIHTTQYEHLDLLTPMPVSNKEGESSTSSFSIKEGLIQHAEFPLLFESSSFLTSPILRDVNGDGIVDIILTDYDGGVYAIGTQPSPSTGKRYFHKSQVPRLHMRRQWVESRINETLGIIPEAFATKEDPEENSKEQKEVSMADDIPMDQYYSSQEKPHDPYHSYFEYTYGSSHEHETILRGVPANILGQDQEHVSVLEERRQRQIKHHDLSTEEQHEEDSITESEPGAHFEDEPAASGSRDEKIEEAQEKSQDQQEQHLDFEESHRRLEEIRETNKEADAASFNEDSGNEDQEGYTGSSEEDEITSDYDDIYMGSPGADDMMRPSQEAYDEQYDDDYPRYDDGGYRGYGDDYHGRYGNSEHDEYYDDKHYVRIPPHILCTPVAAELPKLYTQKSETEIFLFTAVSFYLDEDEYEGFFSYKRFRDRDHGDETEVQRGMYVANAIMIYQYGDTPRWGRQEHLDMSADHSSPVNTTLVGSIPLIEDNTKMGAFALASPTIADLDGDGSLDIILATSMGMLYVMEARNLYARDGWPVQFQHGIEQRVLVEDVRGDTNLEMFVADTSGTITCLNHKGEKLWHRNLLDSISSDHHVELLAASPMILGDVDADGKLDIVQLVNIRMPSGVGIFFLFCISAETGRDIAFFPKRIDKSEETPSSQNEEFLVQKLPSPLLVDLHSDQTWLKDYLHRDVSRVFSKPTNTKSDLPPHGGTGIGLHIVFSIESSVIVIEGATGCAHTTSVGDEVHAMIQADDVHGTGGLDLVVTTKSGNIITLESPAPYHPLNVWNQGEMRGGTNAHAHGYSASQGIFVHDVSRKYRDIFGVYIPVTFEIFDNRPNIRNEPDKQVYKVDIRIGTSVPIFRKTYNTVGVFTERMYIPLGPGYYALTAVLSTTHGLVYEDTFHLGYNVEYMKGFGLMLWLPLLLSSICILLCGTKKGHWDDDEFDSDTTDAQQGILGGPLPE